MVFNSFHFPKVPSANEASLVLGVADLNPVTVHYPSMASGLMACPSDSGTDEGKQAGGQPSLNTPSRVPAFFTVSPRIR
ncbi:unnamed protein product [Arabidopsis halleri]